jgi:imidazolonepropionase-like amidohydrolase
MKYATLHLVIGLLGLMTVQAQQADTLHFSIIMAGNIKGFSKTWKQPDGSYRNIFQYNDRGRGDSLVIDYREDAGGYLTSMQLKGVDYMKNPVEESFSWSDGVAKWVNPAEKEEKKLDAPAFYIGLKGSAGQLVKAMMRNGNSINLLPVGRASCKVVHSGMFTTGMASRKLTLVAVEGMSMTPIYSWVDENNDDFASVSDWLTIIPKGYESLAPQLLEIQKKKELEFFTRLNGSLRQKPAGGGLCIQDVNLFDAEKGSLITGAMVFIEDTAITGVFTGKKPTVPPGWQVIDGKGKTLLPGLWDMHTHMNDNSEGILHLAAGVTSIRDMGNGEDLLTRMADIKAGTLIGPEEAIISGFIDGAGPYAAPTGVLINSMEEGRTAIRKYASRGYQQIKLYSSIKPEWVKPLLDEAKKNKLKVCGHIPAFMTATQAIEAGYDEVTHMNMLVLNFYGDTIDTRSTGRFSIPAQRAASLDLNGKAMQDFIALLKAKKIIVDPTLAVFEELFTGRDGAPGAVFGPVLSRFPAQLQRSLRAGGGGLPVPDGMDATYRESFRAMLRILKKLDDNGITIVPGTDGFAGFTLHRELELYVEAGIPNAKVLQMATIGAASVAGQAGKKGSIAKGKTADLLLVRGNPLMHISDIRNTEIIIRNGIIYDSRKLYEALSFSSR